MRIYLGQWRPASPCLAARRHGPWHTLWAHISHRSEGTVPDRKHGMPRNGCRLRQDTRRPSDQSKHQHSSTARFKKP